MTKYQIKKFGLLLRDRGFKIRSSSKVTVNLKTGKTKTLPTIEAQMINRKWLPLKFPNKRWYFSSEKTRDYTLTELMSAMGIVA